MQPPPLQPDPPNIAGRWRLRTGGGRLVEAREGLTLGRSAACDIVIDDPAAWPIHAIVVMDDVDGLCVAGVGEAHIALADGTMVERLKLIDGVCFYIGMDRLDAILDPTSADDAQLNLLDEDPAATASAMTAIVNAAGESDLSFTPAPPPIPTAAVWPGIPAGGIAALWCLRDGDVPGLVLLACPGCRAAVGWLPAGARFCPSCGSSLPARDDNGALIEPPPGSDAYDVYARLRAEAGAAEHHAAAATGPSSILLGYANAMLGLGWRYEHGRGLSRNPAEAARCYAKAGRLVQRIEPQSLIVAAAPAGSAG